MLKNTVFLHNEYAEIVVENDNGKYSVKVDIEDLASIGKIRVSNTGYAYQCKNGGKSVSNFLMKHTPSRTIVVDHINGDRLDNRKSNLRIVSQQENTQARTKYNRNNTGTIGISYRSNGKYEYYRVTLTDPITKIRYTKQFNINKLGKNKAFKFATEHLKLKKQELRYID